jgi:hypothetical protein
VGGFFLVNLILAVINESFIIEREKKIREVEFEKNVLNRLTQGNCLKSKVLRMSIRIKSLSHYGDIKKSTYLQPLKIQK